MDFRKIIMLTGLTALLGGCVVAPQPYPPSYAPYSGDYYDADYYDYHDTPSYEGYYYARVIFIGNLPYYVNDDRRIITIPLRLHDHFRRYQYSNSGRLPVFSRDTEVRNGYPMSRIVYFNDVPYYVENGHAARPLPSNIRDRFRYTPINQNNAPIGSRQPPMRNEPPAYGRDRNEPPAYGRDRNEPPAYGRDRNEPPAYGRDHNEPPAYGRDRNEPPAYGRDRNEPPAYGRDRNDPPAYGRDRNDPPAAYGRDRNEPPVYGRDRNEPPAAYGRDRNEPTVYGRPRSDVNEGYQPNRMMPPADRDNSRQPPMRQEQPFPQQNQRNDEPRGSAAFGGGMRPVERPQPSVAPSRPAPAPERNKPRKEKDNDRGNGRN